jgi:hypothetical protein
MAYNDPLERYARLKARLQKIPVDAAAALESHRAALAEIARVGGPQAREQRQLATQVHAARLGALRAEAKAAAEEANGILLRARRAQSSPSAAEQVGISRLMGYLEAVPAGQSIWLTLEPRLKRAAEESDESLLWAARAVLPDACEARGEPLQPVSVTWLDMVGGTGDVRAATIAAAEFQRGTYMVTMALNLADGEVVEVSPVPCPNLPLWDGSVVYPGGEPAPTSAQREAAAQARQPAAGVPFHADHTAVGWGRSSARPDAPSRDAVAVPQPASVNGPEGGRP